MSPRVFISYRSSDGADKATALARDLDAHFGNEQIFLDKEDLVPGARWRDAIAGALQECPILLVLLTPNYLGAVDAQGRRCIERDDDPARDELGAGMAAKAHIIPLLCDGVAAMPAAGSLPQPFAQLCELQWGRLRAYDWREDVSRLAGDLRHLGVVPAEPADRATQPDTTPMPLADAPEPSHERGPGVAGRRLALGAGATLLALGAGGWGLWRWRKLRAADLSGSWSARIGGRGATSARDGELVVLMLQQDGRKLALTSSAVDIQRDPDWQNYRDYWRQRFGADLRRVFYRGEGKVLGEDEDDEPPGDAAASAATRSTRPSAAVPVRRISLAVRIYAPVADSEALDSGQLHGTVDLDAQRIHARLWLNSEQAERIVELKRGN